MCKIAGELDDAKGIKIIIAAFAVDAVGRDVKGPYGTGWNGALVVPLQNVGQFTGIGVDQSRGITRLPMAEDAAAGQKPAHHWIKNGGLLMAAKDRLQPFSGGARMTEQKRGALLTANDSAPDIVAELERVGADGEIVPHNSHR